MVTTGNWYHGGIKICHTIEKPDHNNEPYVSCIPAGLYDLHPVRSPKFGDTFEVIDVDGRTYILVHKANKPSELHGCIAPVSKFAVFEGEWGGTDSGKAYDRLMAILGNDKHTLEIKRY